MTHEEKLKKVMELKADIDEKKDLLESIKKLVPEGDTVDVKIRGTMFTLPSKLFRAEHLKIIKTRELEIVALEKEIKTFIK